MDRELWAAPPTLLQDVQIHNPAPPAGLFKNQQKLVRGKSWLDESGITEGLCGM